jgi:hypothetical protein
MVQIFGVIPLGYFGVSAYTGVHHDPNSCNELPLCPIIFVYGHILSHWVLSTIPNWEYKFVMFAPKPPQTCGTTVISLATVLIARWKNCKNKCRNNKMKWSLFESQMLSLLINYRSGRKKGMMS